MLLGTYEQALVPVRPRPRPGISARICCRRDLDRIAPSLEIGFKHFPALSTPASASVVNGAFTFSPDGNPLVGPVHGLKNFWVRLRRHGGLQPRRRRRPRALATGWSTAIRASTSGAWMSRATASGRRAGYTEREGA